MGTVVEKVEREPRIVAYFYKIACGYVDKLKMQEICLMRKVYIVRIYKD